MGLNVKIRYIGHQDGIMPITAATIASRTVTVRLKNMKREIFFIQKPETNHFKSHANTVKFKTDNLTC